MTLFNYDKKHFVRAASDGLVGVDEAGRGCFAGPVVAGCVWVKRSFYENATPVKRADFINDSKQISAETREEIFALIQHWASVGELIFSAGTATVQEIDTLNILGATRLAMSRAIDGVLERAGTSAENAPFAIAGTTDTPLFADKKAWVPILVDGRPLVPFAWRHEAVVHGDATSLAIALASIVAKVTRDHLMCDFSEKFPHYHFESHKGYGTAEHIEALKTYGICELHRLKFLRNLAAAPDCEIPGLHDILPIEPPAPPQGEFDF